MKHILLTCLPLIALASCGKQKNEFAAPPPAPVTVAHPDSREVVIPKTFPATLTGVGEVSINARVTGILEKAYFKEGEKVKAGTKLFTIEKAPYEAKVADETANLQSAKATLELAISRLERLERVKSGAVSEFDVKIAEAEVKQAEAAVSQNQARLDQANIDLSYTDILAPSSGRVSRNLVDVGNLVEGSKATLLATITNDSEVRAYFEVPERGMLKFLANRAEHGGSTDLNQVTLQLADGSSYPKEGTIDYIDSRVDPATRTASVRAVFPNADGTLASGLYALVGYPQKFPNEENPTSVLIPAASILRDLGGDYVWVVDDQNVVRRRGVESSGLTIANPEKPTERELLILSGLSPKDKIIVAGLQRAREGATVAPQLVGSEKPPTAPSPSTESKD